MGAREGFDIVIANPPYGVSLDKEIYKNEFNLDSSDSYGVFTALGLNILKPGGTLCYIMSDTWQTIKTHYKLRKKLFEETKAQCIISVPMKTFKATVNTGIYLFRKSTPEKEKDNFLIAADFHGLDIKNGKLENALDSIINIKLNDKIKDGYTIGLGREKAIYAYRQNIIKKYSNLSYFIASPKLFQLMQDVGNLKPQTYTDEKGIPVMFDIKKQRNLFDQEVPNIYQVNFNTKKLELVKLGDIAEVPQGLATGETDYYIRQLPNTKGSNYQEIDLNLVLKDNELEKIRKDGKLKIDVIENGICTNPERNIHQKRYFGGRYFVPYDKGGASDIEEGWLPNYYVPTPYFIDWSEDSVTRLKTHKTLKGKIASRFQNKQYYFKNGIAYSMTGNYSPTFRSSSLGFFDVKSPLIISTFFEMDYLAGILSSILIRYFCKLFIYNTVDIPNDAIKNIIIPVYQNQKITVYVSKIKQKQKQNLKYDYMTNEQIEIDKLIYEMYNLNEEDIEEVENWYFRRYPKLAKVIEEKLKKKNKGE